MNSNKTRTSRKVRRQRRRANKMPTAPLRVYVEPGDQKLVFKTVARFQTVVTNQGYFYGTQLIKPYAMLQASNYGALLPVYQQFRVCSYNIKVWLPGAATTTAGSTVAKLFRDAPSQETNPTFESLLEERNMKQGRAFTMYYFKWIPLEATDYDYIPISPTADNGRFGKVSMAGIGFSGTIEDVLKPYFEISMTLDFKYLAKATANNQFDDYEDVTAMTETNMRITSPRPVRQTGFVTNFRS